MTLEEIIKAAKEFHAGRATDYAATWSSAAHARLLGDPWDDLELVDNSDYNYDFCDTFEFLLQGTALLAVDISHVAPASRLSGWAVRRRREKTESDTRAIADHVVEDLRRLLVENGFREITPAEQALPLFGVSLQLSEAKDVSLGKSLFKDYDGLAFKVNGGRRRTQ